MIHPQLKFEEVAKNTGLEYEYWEGTEQFKNYIAKWVAWRRGDDDPERAKRHRLADSIKKSGANIFKPGCKTCGKKGKG